jgi:protein-disulfide isomerase
MNLGLFEGGRDRFTGTGLMAAAVTMIVAIAASGARAAGANAKVVATVGNHNITEQELNAKIKPEMAALESKVYELKRQALESLADEYLLAQAAGQAHLSVQDYVKKEVLDKTEPTSEADAKKYYDDHKAQIRMPYDQIKDRLIVALNRQKAEQLREKLLGTLRAKEPVKIMLTVPRVAIAATGHPELGPQDAPVTIVEFGDFQCPYCGRSEDTLKQLRTKYGDKIKLVYMDFPLPMHANALDAAKAARCANEQGKFWPYHDQLFANQTKLAPADLKNYAKQVGLNTAKFDSCFDKAKYEAGVRQDVQEGQKLGLDGTPSFFINGRPMVGALPVTTFEQVIDEELAAAGHKQHASAH